jgi:putative heme-binding domain-containing protein
MRMRIAVLLVWATSVSAQTKQDIADGEKTFRSHCAACHGMHGEGGRGPNLARGEFFHGSTDSDLLQNISNGIPGTDMPGLFYSPDRVRQVVAYIRSLHAAPGATPHGNAGAGEALFRAKGCAECHRVRGEGGRLGPDLTTIGAERSTEYLRRSLVDPNADVSQRYWVATARAKDGGSTSGYVLNEDTYAIQLIDFSGQLRSLSKAELDGITVEKVSKMPSYKDTLSQQELDELVDYLSSLRPRRGVE